jgi:hypothetical protein
VDAGQRQQEHGQRGETAEQAVLHDSSLARPRPRVKDATSRRICAFKAARLGKRFSPRMRETNATRKVRP